MNLVLLFHFVLGVFYSRPVTASLMTQLQQDFTSVLMVCLKEHPVSAKDLEALEKKQMPENEEARCLFACAYKKTGMMDDEGNLSVDGMRALSKKYLGDDATKMKISDDFTDSCVSVNNEPVSDGSKGCDRAALMLKCGIENAPELDFL